MDEKTMAELMRTNWIWTPEWKITDDEKPQIVYFRKEFVVAEGKVPETKKIRITADSRYKLYLNGSFVQEGPQKAMSLREWFVDEAEVAPYLREGQNVAAVEVLRYPAPNFSNSAPRTNDSLYRTEMANLYVEDVEQAGEEVKLAGKSGWKCSINRGVQIVGEDAHPAPIHIQELVHAGAEYAGWMEAGFDDSGWADAVSKMFFDIPSTDAPGCLIPRTIPLMRYEDRQFEKTVCFRDPDSIRTSVNEMMKMQALGAGMSMEAATAAATKEIGTIAVLDGQEEQLEKWNGMLAGKSGVTIPAHTTQIVEISAGAEENGYLLYAFAGGKGAEIATLCSECYAYPPEEEENANPYEVKQPVKGDRTDYKNGKLFGHTSRYQVAGYGTAERPEQYEPYWFRTFRFIQLRITTGEEPLTVLSFCYRACGYPLDVKTSVQTSDPYMASIWKISERTLKRCMQETYFDCPFYEQLQYAMDGRSEILYTYATSADDRLARQAMEAFRLSQRPDGMTNSDAPTVKANPIVSFSIYYILMVHDHMMYFGDQKLVKKYLPSIDSVLNFFDSHLAETGLVGHTGGPIMRDRYWSFIDWSTKWGNNGGVPDAVNQKTRSLTAESLLYIYGLQKAAELAEYTGRKDTADEYRERARKVAEAVQRECFGTYTDQNGKAYRLLQDGPGVDEYSVHAQVFGILAGVVTPAEGKEMLHATVGNPELAQASVSFMFYLFRAMETAGCYEETDTQWNRWREMVDKHLTTCVENDTDERSDCHAWASLALYELPSVVLGVKPVKPGFAQVHIEPQMGAFTQASGEIITPKGMVHVEWKKREDGICEMSYTVPDGIEAV